MAFRLRIPIVAPVGQMVRVIIYARYSTEEQDASSIPDQFEYCKQFLNQNGITEYQPVYFSDAEMSGELVSREGINKVRELIDYRRCDLILCEDSSRLFRHMTACAELIETAVDLNIRVICINDDVDTADEGWDDRVYDALRHHARSNKYTSKRIKRKHEALWRSGAAVGLLRPGFRRVPSVPATATEPAMGPYFDEIDPQLAPVVREVFERIARNDAPCDVALWATEQRLPKPANAKATEWTAARIIHIIRNPVFRGMEVYRKEVVKKERRTGKPRLVPNEPDGILKREMSHLRITSDSLWYAANRAIDARRNRPLGPSGEAHRLA